MMRVLIDLQALQNESRGRGIGRYTRDLFKALARRDDLQLVGLLNGAFSDDLAKMRGFVEEVLGVDNVVVWQGLANTGGKVVDNAARAAFSRRSYELFIASLDIDLLLVCSVFDGFSDDTIVSLTGEGDYARGAILYDLIPLMNPEDFFWDDTYKAYYHQRLAQLAAADILFAISKSTAAEAVEHLPTADRRIVTIGSATDHEMFHDRIPADKARIKALGITKPFVMHLSAMEPRKNFDGLIRAFAQLPQKLRNKHQLVLVGSAHPCYAAYLRDEAKKAGLVPEQLVLLSGLSDTDVVQLYRQAALFCFPSRHEGFGLPCLEAMAAGCPVIGSNRSSVPEVIVDDALLFDPDDQLGMTEAMSRLLGSPSESAKVGAQAVRHAADFTWTKVADRFVEGLRGETKSSKGVKIQSLEDWAADMTDVQEQPPEDEDARAIARALVANHDQLTAWRARVGEGQSRAWRVEGPYDSSYSLALLNRETARALEAKGYDVTLRSMKEPGNFSVDEEYLARNPDLARMNQRLVTAGLNDAGVASRNNYPPIVDDMSGKLRALHHYAWEESGFPSEWVDQFNANLDFITCLSEHVRKIMIDNGVSVPMLTSGCGVDHWERIVPDPDYRVEASGFRFLHVSSCFPRKGVEALIEAFGAAFSADDDVCLIIKTFDNPHNEIRQILADHQAGNAKFPRVHLIFGDLTDEQLKALYAQCDVMVCPSYAEGYGLPLAEAMLSGIPVITTGWGGQLDFCNEGNSWLVDYEFERARSHFNLWSSAWAKVKLESLVNAYRQAFQMPKAMRSAMAERGRRQLLAEHRWSTITDRLSVAAKGIALPEKRQDVRVGWITTWNSKCGIATYSAHLSAHLDVDVRVFSPSNEQTLEAVDPSVRSWRLSKDGSHLVDILNMRQANDVDLFVIQFNYGFFNHRDLGDFIAGARAKGKRVVLFLHSTTHSGDQFAPGAENFHLRHMVPALRACDRLIVHSLDDLNRLKDLDLVDNVALFPHGVLHFDPALPDRRKRKDFVVGTYGFALPHKGLAKTIEAIAMLRAQGHDVRMVMTNAQYPAPVSADYVEHLKSRIS